MVEAVLIFEKFDLMIWNGESKNGAKYESVWSIVGQSAVGIIRGWWGHTAFLLIVIVFFLGFNKMTSNLIKFGFLPAKQSVFLLCDLQEKFRPILTHFQEIVESASRLAKVSKILDVPLIVTEQNPKALGSTVTDIDKDHAKGVFPKTKFSMCIPEVVDELNKIPNLQCVVLFGIETHACIEQTAVELREKGLNVHVVADACTSRSQEDRLLALERMRQMGCFISTTENVIFKLLTDAKHPKFSEIRPLVKNVTPYTGLCGMFSKSPSHL